MSLWTRQTEEKGVCMCVHVCMCAVVGCVHVCPVFSRISEMPEGLYTDLQQLPHACICRHPLHIHNLTHTLMHALTKLHY